MTTTEKSEPREGAVIEWQLRDPKTGEPCWRAETREAIRAIKGTGEGLIVKVVVAH